MITLDPGLLREDGTPDATLLTAILSRFNEERKRLEDLKKTYDREHSIKSRTRLKGLPNNRLAHDLPGYIVAMSAGYLVGNPVSYAPPESSKAAFEPIVAALKAACADNVDAELAVDAAVYGKGVERCYADGKARPRIAQVSPLDAFVVYDDTVEHQPLFGITLRKVLDRNLKPQKEVITLLTATEIVTYERVSKEAPRVMEREPHHFGGVPLTEYWNNSREQGDFEPVVDLIEAYDVLQSDRVNDKQQFTDSILALYGIGSLGVEDTEEVAPATSYWEDEEEQEVPPEKKEALTPSQRLRQTRTLFMPAEGAKAEFLTKPISEGDTDILRQSLKNDIHKLSMVPDLTDENFAGNVSGVAMRFKLLGLEQMTRIKERWFREGLRQRLRLFSAFLALRGAAVLNADEVQITFNRSLPINELENAQALSAYAGIVPREQLLAQVPFVADVEGAMAALAKEQEAEMQRQRKVYDPFGFRDPPQPPKPQE